MHDGEVGYDRETQDHVADFVDHVNGNHSDTLLLLARYAGGRSQASEAEATAVDPEGIELTLRTDGVAERARLTFAETASDLPQLQVGFMSLLATARQKAGEQEPLTSLERELASTATLPTHLGDVVRSRVLTDNLFEVTVGGLHQFEPLGFDEFVYVMAAPAGEAIGDGFDMADFQAQAPGGPVAGAYYTIRRWRPGIAEVDLWVVVHGHGDGVAARMAQAEPGTRLALWGPRRGFRPTPGTSSVLILADETGFAAAAALIEQLDERIPITTVLETVDERHRPELPSRPGLDLRWVYRGDDPPGTGGRLRAATAPLDLGRETSVFGAGESREMTAIRKHLRHERGQRSDQVHLTGYWRRPG